MSYKSAVTVNSPEQVLMEGINAGAAKPSGKAIYEQRKNYGKKSVSLGEISQYNVEHLVTFAMERKDGILTVEDSIRKLKLLDLRKKVWAQEVLLHVDEKDVKLFDIVTQEELEHFPLPSIQHVQTVMDSCDYNVLALVVKYIDQKIADIHLFHCATVSAEIICADIESASSDFKDKKGRKIRPETLRRHKKIVAASVIPPPPSNPPPAPPTKDINFKEISWVDDIEEEESPKKTANEVSSEMQAARVNRDVEILNHTLDDIEAFANKLRKSAEAMKDLTVRKSKSDKKKNNAKSKRAPGEGVLTLRSKLPPDPEFIDSYQKIKFAFNCLARLQSQLQRPSAVDLCHFLFGPLDMAVNARGTADLARSIETPLLTKSAIEMLQNCMTTREADLYRRLGENWCKTRSDYPSDLYIAPYIPLFLSGWEPPPLATLAGSGKSATDLAAKIQLQANLVQRAEKERRNSGVSQNSDYGPASPRADINQQDAFKKHVENHVARNQNAHSTPVKRSNSQEPIMCRSMYVFNGRNKNELSVVRDEVLEVLENNKAWWKLKNKDGNVGFAPGNHMVIISSARSPASPPSPPPYSAPYSETNNFSSESTNIPPPPPMNNHKITPVPVPQLKPVNKQSSTKPPENRPNILTSPSKNSLQEELKMKMSGAPKQRNFSIPKKNPSSSSANITEKSTPDEVKAWLQSYGFSDMTNNSLGVLNGAQIFTLSKDELKQVCDEEGSRVYSQLLVQKSLQHEQNNNETELEKIMRKRQNIANNNTSEAAY